MSGGVEDALLLHSCNEAWTRRNRLPKDVGSYERRWGSQRQVLICGYSSFAIEGYSLKACASL
ncbi:hypothetical protein KSB_41310 [Ktedonobacter robiniae]|uniref:Uncharacterized protein n=1 Tax=Ktedonobacter robiniae TaxID=2778365 RepID=A0ABQ3US92_9CHLR|nr:hypothetical protein KSB_41310 [Ktedonobacter robiniae]